MTLRSDKIDFISEQMGPRAIIYFTWWGIVHANDTLPSSLTRVQFGASNGPGQDKHLISLADHEMCSREAAKVTPLILNILLFEISADDVVKHPKVCAAHAVDSTVQ